MSKIHFRKGRNFSVFRSFPSAPVYDLEMRVFLTMITDIFMLIGLISIQKNHANHLKSHKS